MILHRHHIVALRVCHTKLDWEKGGKGEGGVFSTLPNKALSLPHILARLTDQLWNTLLDNPTVSSRERCEQAESVHVSCQYACHPSPGL
jgi:hypothetical protein